MAKSNTIELVITAKDAASRVLGRVGGAVGAVKDRLFSLQGLAAGAGLGLVAKSALDTADSFEQLETKLDVLTKGKGRETLDELNEWALRMPVNTQQAVDAFVMMKAMGLDPTIKSMTTLVNVASLFGDEAMTSTARALGQMQTLGKVSAEELNQLAEVGINARKYLKESFGMTVEEVQKSGIEIDQVILAITEGMDRDFGGAAERGQTKWRGLWNSAVSLMTEAQKQVMDAGLFEYLKEQLSQFVERVDELRRNGKLAEWAKQTSDTVVSALERIPPAAEAAWVNLKKLTDWFGEHKDLLQSLGMGAAVSWATRNPLAGAVVGATDYGMKQLSGALYGDEAKKNSGIIAFLTMANETLDDADSKIWAGLKNSLGFGQPAGEYRAPVSRDVRSVPLPEEEAPTKKPTEEKEPTSKVKPVARPTIAPAALSEDLLAESEWERWQEVQRTAMEELDSLYDQGRVTIEQYFRTRREEAEEASRREIETIEEVRDARIAELEEKAKGEDDAAKRRQIEVEILKERQEAEDEIHRVEQERLRTLQAINVEERKANEELDRQVQNKRALLDDLRRRGAPDGDMDELEQRQQRELDDLDTKHEQELQKLRDYHASKSELEEAMALQSMERAKLVAKHEQETYRARLNWTQNFVGSMADSLRQLYDSGLAHSKEAFAMYKAFAVAETLISTYAAAQDAYHQGVKFGGPVGTVLGTALAAAAIAAGLGRLAAIASSKPQGYAYGGLIGGPDQGDRADNVTIRATPGEYMMDRPTVRHYGVAVMEALRRQRIPKSALAGFSLPELPGVSSSRVAYADGGQIGSGSVAQGGAGGELTIINALDSKQLLSVVASAEGGRVIINHIATNSARIRKIINEG